MRTRTPFAVAALAAVALAACGSDSKTTPTTTTTAATTTLAPVTSSTVPQTTTPASTTAGDSTTTTAPAEPVMPLTGLPITDPAAAARPALVVKIDNFPKIARPQSGLGPADLVYEENVEGITRFAAVFQSNVIDPVGPIRSGRTQDVDLLGSLNKPIFAWSGGNPGVTAAIEGSDFDVIRVDANQFAKAAGTYRDKSRAAPHNLYSTSSGLRSFTTSDAGPPPQQFGYLPAGAGAAGEPAGGADVSMESVKVEWRYDAASNAYQRFQDGQAHVDRESGPISAVNVVVLTVDYRPSQADARSPEAQTEGSGAASVFTGGKVVTGTWTRNDRLQPFTLTDTSGAPILLTPGNTWVELSRSGATPL